MIATDPIWPQSQVGIAKPMSSTMTSEDRCLENETGPTASSLFAELEHRHRNFITVAISIMRTAMREASDVDRGMAIAERRLRNLDAANRLLAGQDLRCSAMATICIEALSPFRDEGARFRVGGEAVTVPKPLALALSLAMYEMATNAAKHGALSVPSGEVDVSWTVANTAGSDVDVAVLWRERNGPGVHTPHATGFGSAFMQQVLGHHLVAPIARSWGPDGLDCTFTVRFAASPTITPAAS